LQDAQSLPAHLPEGNAARDGTEFDPEEYFSILTRIAVEPGFALDYVFRLTPDRGFPVLYTRRADAPGYTTYDEYLAGTGSDPVGQGDPGWLDQVYVVDGTPDGFFEYVVLRVMGGRFYRHWHALEDDAVVVATAAAVEEALTSVADEMDPAEMARARAADPTPQVTYAGGSVTVVAFVFTRWGGLQRRTYEFDQLFPQPILGLTVETVAACDCGIPL
jgi:hypothetical protein